MASLKNTTINDTGYLQLPNGTDAQRPAAANGQMRYNTTSGQVEVYNNGWIQLSTNYNIEVILVGGGGGGGAANQPYYGGGGGGGGGGFLQNSLAVTPGTNYSLVIGAGGAGCAQQNTGYGTTGGDTTGFGFTARGGQGGASYQYEAWNNPSNNVGSGGGAPRDGGNYGVPATQDGQGNYGGSGKVSCGSAGGGGGAGSNGYNGREDCSAWRLLETACGGDGRLVTWTGNTGGIIATKVKIYSTYGGGQRSANYTVSYSDDGINFTSAFTGVMDSNNATGGTGTCGIVQGTGTGTGSYGRHIYWRYTVGSTIVGHHPRTTRLWLEDAAGNQYLLKRFVNDQCSDQGNYQFGVIQNQFQEGVWYAAGGGGSFECGADNRSTYANGGKLPERGGRGTSGINGYIYGYGSNGDANSGFGGGGVNGYNERGGYNGGSGIVMIRYYGPQRGSGGTVTTSNGYTIHTFTTSGTFTA